MASPSGGGGGSRLITTPRQTFKEETSSTLCLPRMYVLPGLRFTYQRLIQRYRPRIITDVVFLTLQLFFVSGDIIMELSSPNGRLWGICAYNNSRVVGKLDPPDCFRRCPWRRPSHLSPCPHDIIPSKMPHGMSRSRSACRSRLCTHVPLKVCSEASSAWPQFLSVRLTSATK